MPKHFKTDRLSLSIFQSLRFCRGKYRTPGILQTHTNPHSLSHMHIHTLYPILKSHDEGKAEDTSTLVRTHQKWQIRSLVFSHLPQYCIIPLLFTLISRSGILYFIAHCRTNFVSFGRHATTERRRTRTPVLYDSKRKVQSERDGNCL